MKPKRQCVLHVGTMKTGTTSIQSWLSDNQEWLKEQGWVYPGWPMRSADRIEAVVNSLAADQNLVISDEGLWHFMASPRSDTPAIREHLADFDVTVIVYLRRPDQFLAAWFAQGLKSGTGSHDLQRFLSHAATRPSSMVYRLNMFSSLWDDDQLKFVPYERSQLKNGDAVEDFLARTGLPTPPVSPDVEEAAESRNVTPDIDLLLLAGIMRTVFHAPEEQIGDMLRDGAARTDRSVRRQLFLPEELERIHQEFLPFFRHIQRRFGGGVSPDFFSDWTHDERSAPVAALRPAYDHLMSTVDRASVPADDL